MKVELDENLPDRIVAGLPRWATTRTQDLGFSDERRYPPGSHQGILVLRLSDDRSRAAAERLTALFQAEAVEAWAECLVVVTDHKIRVRRPGPRAT